MQFSNYERPTAQNRRLPTPPPPRANTPGQRDHERFDADDDRNQSNPNTHHTHARSSPQDPTTCQTTHPTHGQLPTPTHKAQGVLTTTDQTDNQLADVPHPNSTTTSGTLGRTGTNAP